MSNIKQAEIQIYEAVQRGELEIDKQGRIWRIGKRGWDRWNKTIRTNQCRRVRAEKLLPTGYLMVRAMIDKARANGLAHRLVWMHFNGKIPEGLTINHINGVKTDNRPENLELATHSEQIIHARESLGKMRQDGEWNNAATLTATQVLEIRKRRLNGEKLLPIAKDYGIAYQTVSKIARNERREFG